MRVPAQTYDGLLTSVLVNKLPPELRLVVTRGMTGDVWDLDRLMTILEQEVSARECAFIPSTPRRTQPRLPTAATLVANSPGFREGQVSCVYCNQEHTSNSCTTVADKTDRKELLRKAGRCFVCLKRHHLSRDCRSKFNCKNCRGRHHISICTRTAYQNKTKKPSEPLTDPEKNSEGHRETNVPRTSSVLYVGAQTPVLLQTARFQLVGRMTETVARAVLDSGSQKTYITHRVRDTLKLPTVATETIQIQTFGTIKSCIKTCDVVNLGILTKNGGRLEIAALVVPVVCSPLNSQPINDSGKCHNHLLGLELVDSAEFNDELGIDLLIGSDWYWSLVTGKVIKGESGPIAIHTKVGWILSGPATASKQVAVNLAVATTHALKIDSFVAEPSLDDQLKRFWELESLGIPIHQSSVYERFLKHIRFDGKRYQVCLPWKEHHSPLPDHYGLCRKRLERLLRKLKQNPQRLSEYNGIIREQLKNG